MVWGSSQLFGGIGTILQGGASAALALLLLIVLVFIVASIAGMWALFEKANQPGWGALVPFYNAYLYFKIAGMSGWMVLAMFIPLVGVVVWIMASIGVAKRFGKGTGYGIALGLIGPILIMHLGFGSARYQGAPA